MKRQLLWKHRYKHIYALTFSASSIFFSQIGINGTSIGIISPHRAHIELLKRVLNKHEADIVETIPIGCGIEVNNVEKFQGRHKDVIIYSCSKSDNPEQETHFPNDIITGFLSEKLQLINAVNRCKQKFIVLGDVESMQIYTPFEALFQNISPSCKVSLSDVSMGLDWKTLLNNLYLFLE